VPLYEYQCKQCGHRFEKIQSFSAPDEKECPVCKGEVERLISAPAIQFKGSGWYVNDYAAKPSGSSKNGGDSRNESGKGDSNKSEGGENKSSKSSEKSDKPASSSESKATPASTSSNTSSSSSSKKSE
jgi:putative FmdB family regulatory protein